MVSTCHASDKGLNGKRFNVDLIDEPTQKTGINGCRNHSHHDQHEHNQHDHHNWQQIRQFLTDSNLEKDVKANAIGIFGLLAVAEAKVHNMDVDTVQFHEVGAWDCIVDIISASWLIKHSDAKSWSVSPLPWGGGTVKCAHGNIPIPAPATLNLLQGFEFTDDGVTGERITPTGAAILAWISPSQTVTMGVLKGVGYGFGTRKMQGRANVLRASLIETTSVTQTETITVIQCDIDDMTSEMLAIARENIRDLPGVLETTEVMSHGKKNRFISTLTILCQPSGLPVIIDSILNNTSTLGVRYWQCNRVSLQRLHHKIPHNGKQFDVKSVRRPDNSITSKLEADHITSTERNYQQRNQLKRDIEQQAEVEHYEHNR